MRRLSVLFNHLQNKNGYYPTLTIVEASDLKVILSGSVKACEIVANNMPHAHRCVESDAEPITSFELFSHLPEVVRKSIWSNALSYEEFLASSAPFHTSDDMLQLCYPLAESVRERPGDHYQEVVDSICFKRGIWHGPLSTFSSAW